MTERERIATLLSPENISVKRSDLAYTFEQRRHVKIPRKDLERFRKIFVKILGQISGAKDSRRRKLNRICLNWTHRLVAHRLVDIGGSLDDTLEFSAAGSDTHRRSLKSDGN